jgi:hypothetical protein
MTSINHIGPNHQLDLLGIFQMHSYLFVLVKGGIVLRLTHAIQSCVAFGLGGYALMHLTCNFDVSIRLT